MSADAPLQRRPAMASRIRFTGAGPGWCAGSIRRAAGLWRNPP